MIKVNTPEKYNLTTGIISEINNVPYTALTFNGGEEHINIHTYKTLNVVFITAKIKNSSEVMRLFLIVDALRQQGAKFIRLFLPYVPYGRQDRVCVDGDAFSLKVFCNLLNSLSLDEVAIVDPHSDVTPALINNCDVTSQLDIINSEDILSQLAVNTIPISPDAGANKKVQKISEYCMKEFIRADKVRDVRDGSIKETIVYCDDLKGQNVTIYDDICDGGRTFIEIAKKLKEKNAGEINLCVTHGIFSKGYDCLFESGITHIYTTDSLDPISNENVTIINL